MMSRALQLGHSSLVQSPDGSVLTMWPDGNLPAVAHHDAAYGETARRLGYGADQDRQCWAHEATHALLAHHLGLTWGSPTLRHEARLETCPLAWRLLEELAVLGIQAASNGLFEIPGFDALVDEVRRVTAPEVET